MKRTLMVAALVALLSGPAGDGTLRASEGRGPQTEGIEQTCRLFVKICRH